MYIYIYIKYLLVIDICIIILLYKFCFDCKLNNYDKLHGPSQMIAPNFFLKVHLPKDYDCTSIVLNP